MVIKNISEAKACLSALVEQVVKGQVVLIAKAGKPLVRLVPYEGVRKERSSGALKGKIRIEKDFDSLPAGIARAFGLKD